MSSNKSICFIMPGWITKQIGGAELQLFQISEELLKRGWEVEVFTHGKRDGKNKKSKYYNHNIKYHYYRTKPFLITGFFRIFVSLLKTNSKYYYQRTNAPLLTYTCAIYCKLFNRKMIYAIAGDHETEDYSYFKELIKSNKKRNILYFLHKIDRIIADRIFYKGKTKANIILTQTYDQQRLLLQNFNLNSYIIRNSTVSGYVDNEDSKENIILWVGNLRTIKRPEIFIDLVNNIDIENWQLIMIGNGNGYTKELQTIKNNNFRFLGQLPYDETISYFKKAKILINTSKSEGFSNTFLEAWFYRVYILSLNVDPDRIISEMKLGSFYNDDQVSLKNDLIEIMNGTKSLNSTLDAAERYVKEEFNLEKNIEKFIELTEKL